MKILLFIGYCCIVEVKENLKFYIVLVFYSRFKILCMFMRLCNFFVLNCVMKIMSVCVGGYMRFKLNRNIKKLCFIYFLKI